jgi:LPS O-antigen subunit length determinant protein (WzzB/FepE family)
MIIPQNYTASLNILALPDSQADVYIELNEAKIITADKESLLALFVEDLKTQSDNGLGVSIVSVTPTQSRLSFPTQAQGQLTEKVVDALALSNQSVGQQLELNFSRQSAKFVRHNLLAIEGLELERQQKVTLFKTNQNQQIAKLENQTEIARANYDASIKKEISLLQQQISISRTNYDASIKKQISLLQQQISISRTNYDASVRKKIAHLTEQATIAHSLNIDKAQTTGDGKLLGIDDYFKGYLALEQTIKLINSRTSTDDFIPNLADLEQQINHLNTQKAENFVPHLAEKEIQINQLKSQRVEFFLPDLTRIEFLKSELLKNKEIKKAEVMLAKTPIGTDQFSAAVYNLDTLVYKNNTKTSLILALSIVLGGMLGIFVLLIRNVLIKQD